MGIHSFSDLNASMPEKNKKPISLNDFGKFEGDKTKSSLFDDDKPEKKTRRKKIEDMSYEEVVTRAKDVILYALSMSPKTRKQLADKLKEKEIPDEAANDALNRMTEVGLIDDVQFAKSWVYSRHTYKGLSAMAIKRELKQKGVEEEIINDALENLGHDEEWERALELVKRKAHSTRNVPHDSRVRRLVGMLARKGYNGNIAFNAVKEVLNEEKENTVEEWIEESND